MSQFEYKVIPTPRRPKRAKGVKGEPARFANALTEAINEIAVEGWEFYKTETLPMDAKPGFFSKRIETFQSVMVFRRDLERVVVAEEETLSADAAAIAPALVAISDELEDLPTFEGGAIETPVDEPDVVEVEEKPAEDVVEFDADNIDPLKKMVDQSRASE